MNAFVEVGKVASRGRRKSAKLPDDAFVADSDFPTLSRDGATAVHQGDEEPVLTKEQKRALARHQLRIDAKAYEKSADAEIDRILSERSDRYGFNAATRGANRATSFLSRLISVSSVLSILLVLGTVLSLVVLRDASLRDFKEDPLGIIASRFGFQSDPATPELASVASQAKSTSDANIGAVSNDAVAPKNIVAQSLKQIGATKCLARANELPNVLAQTTEAVVLQKPARDPDASLITAMLVPNAASKVKGASFLSLAPNQSNGCGAIFQSIDIVEKPCAKALPEIFGANRATPVGTNGFSVVTLNSSARVLAIPSTNTCVLVKQEYVL